MAGALHEAGHWSAGAVIGCPLDGVLFSASGIRMRFRMNLVPYRKEIALYLAGPAANLLACGAILCAIRHGMTERLLFLFFCNALFAAFNLLPIAGLDGGEALRSGLSCVLPPDRTDRICEAVSLIFLALTAAAGILIAVRSGGNISLFLMAPVLGGEAAAKKRKAAKLLS